MVEDHRPTRRQWLDEHRRLAEERERRQEEWQKELLEDDDECVLVAVAEFVICQR